VVGRLKALLPSFKPEAGLSLLIEPMLVDSTNLTNINLYYTRAAAAFVRNINVNAMLWA
jgi:hypothetical protein